MLNDYPSTDVVLIQRASINFYPPTINQANLLAESGLKVAILDGGVGPKPISLNPTIRLIRPLDNRIKGKITSNISLIGRVFDNIRFTMSVQQSMDANNVRVRIGYDSPVIATFLGRKATSFTICHFHDYPEPLGEGYMADLRNKLARRFSRISDMVVMPDYYRAVAFLQEENLRQLPVVVPNCPRILLELPAGQLRPMLVKKDCGNKRLVLFQGAISKNYYADKIIESMPWWPTDSVMVFVGPVKNPLQNELIDIANQLGVLDRIVFIPQVPYAELFKYTVDADLAFSMIKPFSFNFAHMSGASNKRYEYMACGIPQITNHGPGVKELIEQSGAGICVDPEVPEEIGQQVSYLLNNDHLRKEMSTKARKQHLVQYNYEQQFIPVLEKITTICCVKQTHNETKNVNR